MEDTIIYNGIAFKKSWVASKTFSDFAKHEQHHKLTSEQLKEVWNESKKQEKVKQSEKQPD